MKSWQLKTIFYKWFGKKIIKSANTYVKGIDSEQIATNFLKSKNYKIIKRNFKTNLGEIDIIALHDNCLVICEVKYRNNQDILFYSIITAQQKRIKNALLVFLTRYKQYNKHNIRFDAIFINNKNDIEHIMNAW